MIKSLDYLFYRVNRFYFKIDKANSITASIAITGFEMFILWDIVAIFRHMGFDIRTMTSGRVNIFVFLSIAIFYLILYLNFYKYKSRLSEMRRKWDRDRYGDKHYTVKGWLVFLVLMAPVILAFLIM